MSRFEDEQQPGPPLREAERESEPRLLTRPEPTYGHSRSRSTHKPQHSPENGLTSWASRLRPKPQPVPPKPRQRRSRVPFWIAGVLLALVLIAAIVLVVDLRRATVASLPQIDGDTHVAGLHAPVSVVRDDHGVPSITASSLDDLLFAQGYVTASDRLWQMEGIRRHAAGELSEILGPSMVEHDRRQRLLQLRATADRAVAHLPPDQLAELEAYARGVNAYIDTHRDRLPVQFRLLAYKPAPWSPRDSLLVALAMWQDLSTEFPQKLNRELLSEHLAPNLLPDMYPVGSWRDQPPDAQSRNLTTPHDVEEIPLDPSQSSIRPAASPNDLLAVTRALTAVDHCPGCRPGSNNWVVSGAHTASGAPLLSSDMHLNLLIPDTWYEAALHADVSAAGVPGESLDVVGFTLPGAPFVIVGRNPHVGWGVTNLGADVQDLRVEHLRGSGNNTEYERPDGSWTLANHHAEHIRVRGSHTVELDVLTTSHTVGTDPMETPIVSPLFHAEARALSLAWSAYDPNALQLPLRSINTASDGASLIAAFSTLGGPSLNLVWADAAGHIGYHALGLIPIRGLPLQHPRPVASPVPTGGDAVPLPPEGDDEAPTLAPSEGPQAELEIPHLVLSAFRPVRRTAHRSAAPQRGRVATTPARNLRSRGPQVAEQAPAAPGEAPLIPTPQPRNYTVGSPISPVPVDALDTSQEWSGYIAYSDLPSVTDPAGGFLSTANGRITPDDYPWAVANDWPDPFRAERIVHLLSGRSGLTPADMLRLQNDVHSDVDHAIAQRLAYALDHASPKALGDDRKRLTQAADLMRGWNGDVKTNSAGAAVVSTVRKVLWPSLLIPQIMAHDGPQTDARSAARIAMLYTWDEQTTALELLLQNQPAQWLPHGFANWNDFLATVTERGLKGADAPSDLGTWQYGQIHAVEIADPIFGDHHILSDLLGFAGTTGRQPAPGDDTTVKQMELHFGPSERFTADLSSPDATYGNIATGQSEVGRSPWYLDQFNAWLVGTTFDLPSRTGTGTHTLRLLPQ